MPPEARWSHLKAQTRQPTIGQLVDDAKIVDHLIVSVDSVFSMAGIERDNPALKGVLPFTSRSSSTGASRIPRKLPRRPDGLWRAEGRWPAGAGEPVDWSRGRAGEMLTLNALRVLRAAGRIP